MGRPYQKRRMRRQQSVFDTVSFCAFELVGGQDRGVDGERRGTGPAEQAGNGRTRP